MKHNVLIIIPAYNEEGNIKRVVDDLETNYPQYDYVVVNDGSRDHTPEILDQNNFNHIDIPVNVGLACVIQTGMMYAYDHGYAYAVQYDGDGQHDAAYIQHMIEAMNDCDVCIGSRFIDRKKPFSMRMLGGTIISFTMKLTTGRMIKDPTSGMRMYNRITMKIMADSIDYGPEPDTIAHLIRSGARVKEIQADMHERISGESYLNLVRSIKYMIHMCFSILFVQWCRKKNKLERVREL